jgi:hypothetical protein
MPASANPTLLADLWVPQIWVQGAAEQMRNLPSVINSGIAVRNALFDEFASGPGTTMNLPAFHDITDINDEVQQENVDADSNAISALKQICVPMNRQVRFDVTALSAQVSGSDPVGHVLRSMAMTRLKNRQKMLIAIFRGIFGSVTGDNGCVSANINDMSSATGNVVSDNLIKRTSLTATLTLLGELADGVINGGVMICHPVIREAFAGQNTSIALLPAETPLIVNQFGGLAIYASNALVTAGPNGTFIYDTYISKKGTFAWGEKPQAGDVIDVAALQMYMDKMSNNTYLFDRTRNIIHPNGIQWVGGTQVYSSPQNTELALPANWNLQFSSADRTGFVCIKSNG